MKERHSLREFAQPWLDALKRYSQSLPILPDLLDYWKVYGGWHALIRSPWLWAAAILTAFLYRTAGAEERWAGTAVSILPSTLGFSVSAAAILLAFPSTSAFKFFKENGRYDSYYMGIAATITHYSMVQLTSIILIVISQSTNIAFINYLSFFVFMYALISGFGVITTLYTVARDYNSSPE